MAVLGLELSAHPKPMTIESVVVGTKAGIVLPVVGGNRSVKPSST
jgi:hypothetical protein